MEAASSRPVAVTLLAVGASLTAITVMEAVDELLLPASSRTTTDTLRTMAVFGVSLVVE